ncbi:MAG: hypothetical protein NTZ50_08585 [Chloroflexi bacterium]|nr:hypothetical protein [Chloroflexota bacterium]
MTMTDTASWAASSYCRPGTESRSRAFAVKAADAGAIAHKGVLLVVVDGSMSPAQPEKAAEVVGQSLLRFFYSAETGSDPQIALRFAVQRAVAALESIRPPGSAHLAVAVAAGVVWRNELLLARVGDAAAFLLRNGRALSLSNEPADFDSILESSLTLQPGDRVALINSDGTTLLRNNLPLQQDVTHATQFYRNMLAADPPHAHGALVLFDQPATSSAPTPPPQQEPQPPAAPPPPEPAAPVELAAPTTEATPTSIVDEPALPQELEPELDLTPPTPPPPPKRSRRPSLIPLLLMLAAAVAAPYFLYTLNGKEQWIFVRTQAQTAAANALTFATNQLNQLSVPTSLLTALQSPLALPEPMQTQTASTAPPLTSPLATPTQVTSATTAAAATAMTTATVTTTAAATAAATPTPTATATPTTVSPTATPEPSPTPQPIGEVIRSVASPTAVQIRRTPIAAPTQAPTANRRLPTAIPPTAAPIATPEGQLPDGAFPPLPTPPP